MKIIIGLICFLVVLGAVFGVISISGFAFKWNGWSSHWNLVFGILFLITALTSGSRFVIMWFKGHALKNFFRSLQKLLSKKNVNRVL